MERASRTPSLLPGTRGPRPRANALLILGATNRFNGASRLPINVSRLGMTPAKDCWLNTQLFLVNSVRMIAGKGSFPAGIPNNASLKGIEAFTQYVVDDPGIGSFTTTQGGLVRIQ